ncbi:MAG: patatin-like phospholipase family protein [Planctomycetes bacterium]|nr:patatin-like phospholipase family protein [Planctomycetota bacterium]
MNPDPGHGQNGLAHDPTHPRRTILVLGGGGMRGFCHIGVIRAIERLGIRIDEVVGTSMGAVMGGLWATGMDSRRIEETAGEISIKDYFKLNLLKFLVKGYRHASVYKGRTFHQFLRKWLPQASFAELPRPFFCNALSLNNGTSRFFGLPGAVAVPVADAVYASACLPTIFEPIAIGDDHYIDGGMTETLALRLAKARRADLVIAVDLSHRDQQTKTPYRASLPHILFQTYEVMGQALNEHNLHHFVDQRTVVIKPKVSHMGLLDMPDVREIVRLGEREAVEVLTTHPLTRWLCDPEVVAVEDRGVSGPRDHVHVDVDMNACIHCGICAATCVTQGFAAVPLGDVVRKLHHYECTRDLACERNCPTGAIRLGNV